MKRIITTGILILVVFFCYGQTIDTLAVMKLKAMGYTNHELARPKTYISIAWSQFFHYKDDYSLLNIFTAKDKRNNIVKLGYHFHYDANMNLIWVNTGPIEKQLKVLKFELEQLKDRKRMVNETLDRQIEIINDARPASNK
jgi:hypothetical protein